MGCFPSSSAAVKKGVFEKHGYNGRVSVEGCNMEEGVSLYADNARICLVSKQAFNSRNVTLCYS